MNKTELLNQLSSNAEERLLLSKALDQIQLADSRSTPSCTAFLSPAEAGTVLRLLSQVSSVGYRLVGGYEDAERQRCAFLPDWQSPEDVEPAELVSALRATWYAPHTLTHRDFLGSLMGLGMKREAVGDILVGQGSCDILLLPSLESFVLNNLEYAGHEKLHLERISLSDLHFPQRQVKELHDTVPSLRLDAVAAAGFKLSRSKAADAINAGKFTVNWQSVTRTDFLLSEGDILACRGMGKCKLKEIGQLSRKGRINLVIERYL
jgi:RNA-binding protein YlmH